jgi:hypothetical protein
MEDFRGKLSCIQSQGTGVYFDDGERSVFCYEYIFCLSNLHLEVRRSGSTSCSTRNSELLYDTLHELCT